MITSNGDLGLRLLPLYFKSLTLMKVKFFLSMLFCHSTPIGDGQDDIKELKIVLDPTKTFEPVSILALGISAKNQL